MAQQTFRHGVASGDPLVDRVVIWTCVEASGPVEVRWTVARDPGLHDVVRSGVVGTDADRDHTVKVDVGGLEPDGRYFYGFEADGASSPVGRTRTMPLDPDALRFALAACAKYNAGRFGAYGGIAALDDLHFVLHLGDYIYEASQTPPASQTPSPDIGRPFEPLHECRTLADYRARYRQYRRDPDLQAMHAAHAVIATVDDHEFADNAYGDGSTEHHPDRDGPYAARKADAYRAWTEWMPARRWSPSPEVGIWRSFAFGTLARLAVVDERSNRSFARDGRPAPDRTQLGAAQRDWLAGELAAPGCDWTLVGSPGVLADTWQPGLHPDRWVALRKLKLMDLEVDGPDDDQWDWYTAERDEVLRALAASPGRSVVMSGDIHCGLVAELAVDGAPAGTQVVTPSVSSQNLDDKLKYPARSAVGRDHAEALCAAMPAWRWFDPDSHGHVVVDLDRERLRADWYAVEGLLDTSGRQVHTATAVVDRRTGVVSVTDRIGR